MDVAHMVARFAGASLALFAFAVAVIAGLSVGNPPVTILSRGILALFVFFFIGLALGGAAQLVLREYRTRREADIREQYEPGAATAAGKAAGAEAVIREGVPVGA